MDSQAGRQTDRQTEAGVVAKCATILHQHSVCVATVISPTYLLGLFILTSSCTGRQSLRSASRGDFVVPHARTAIKQHKAFSFVGPSFWNSLPSEIRSLPRDLSSSFYKLLKTFIFARAWAGSASE